jgi:hypothetical protein
MANERKKNAIYINEVGTVTVDALKPICYAILITPNSGDARLIIKESVGGMIILDIVIGAKESRFIDFGDLKGIELTSNFEVTELTSIDSVIMYGEWLQPVGRARG